MTVSFGEPEWGAPRRRVRQETAETPTFADIADLMAQRRAAEPSAATSEFAPAALARLQSRRTGRTSRKEP